METSFLTFWEAEPAEAVFLVSAFSAVSVFALLLQAAIAADSRRTVSMRMVDDLANLKVSRCTDTSIVRSDYHVHHLILYVDHLFRLFSVQPFLHDGVGQYYIFHFVL